MEMETISFAPFIGSIFQLNFFLRLFESDLWMIICVLLAWFVPLLQSPPQHPFELGQSSFPLTCFPLQMPCRATVKCLTNCCWSPQGSACCQSALLIPDLGFLFRHISGPCTAAGGFLAWKAQQWGPSHSQGGLLSFPGAEDMKNCFCV